jgi:hypothetical protein
MDFEIRGSRAGSVLILNDLLFNLDSSQAFQNLPIQKRIDNEERTPSSPLSILFLCNQNKFVYLALFLKIFQYSTSTSTSDGML